MGSAFFLFQSLFFKSQGVRKKNYSTRLINFSWLPLYKYKVELETYFVQFLSFNQYLENLL